MSRTILYNAEMVSDNRRLHGYIVVAGREIEKIAEGEPSAEEKAGADVVEDLGGRLLLPGAIDTHVHFREPGLTHKASIATESAAAVSGGVTSYIDMPNTRPATTTMAAVADKKRIAAERSYANYGFFLGVTNSNLDEIQRADRHEIPGVKLFMGSSTGNMLVDDESTMSQLFRTYKGVIAVHAEDEALLAAARKRLAEQYGEAQPVVLHSQARPAEACYKATERAVALARKYGTRLHILHVSTARELSLLSAGDMAGKRITAETCPHYLLFEENDLGREQGYMLKCNPAIKSSADRDALVKALSDKLIDTIATDHAPHLAEEKQGTLLQAASGMPGVRFMLVEMLTLAARSDNALSVERVVELTAHNPARLYGIERRGYLRRGYYADMVVVEPTAKYRPEVGAYLPAEEMSPCSWTPYAMTEVGYRVVSTYVNGEKVYDGERVARRGAAMAMRFGSEEDERK
ncbi:MAG: dihydroorotase [Bacteroidales bacterium]|nr:dihydroorotase [Bacteroidales bacterium]